MDRSRSFLTRLLACTLCLSLAYSSAFAGFNSAGHALYDTLTQVLRGRPGMYTQKPQTVVKKDPNGRQARTRGGMWSERAIRNAASSQYGGFFASLMPEPFTGHTLAVAPEPGSSMPWEGSVAGINTGNGNKLTSVPLTGWKDRGGMPVEFTLYHNSQTPYSDELGAGWTWSYDIYINDSSSTEGVVHWGDGTCIPFAKTGGTYTAPSGIYDTLVKNIGGTYTLTRKNGWVYEFNSAGFCHEIRDRNGNTITLTLDSSNYCTRITGPSGRYIDITQDSNGKYFTNIEAPDGAIWAFNYTGNSLTSVDWPALNSTTYSDQFTYNLADRITTHTDRRGKAWTYTYNTDGSLASETTPRSKTTSYTYQSWGTTITDPRSYSVVHNYGSGKLSSVTDEASYSEGYTYTGYLVTTKTDRRGEDWDYTYDSRGNVLTVTNPLGKTWTYTYSSGNDLLTAEDPLGNETVYTYDSAGNLLTITDPLSRVTTNTYDAYGQLDSTENPESETTTIVYSTNGYPTTVTDPLTHANTMVYDVLGRLTSVTDANSNQTQFEYDVWGRLTGTENPDTTTTSRAYDAVGNVTSSTNERGKTTTYAYLDDGLLSTVTNANSEVETYGYDNAGNRTTVTNGRGKVRTYTYTPRGEVYTLTLADSSVETWSYDGNGNVTAYTNPLSQTINYAYDDAGNQTGVDYPTGTDTSFAYDWANRRTSMTDATGTTSWTYDDASQITDFDTPQGSLDYTYDDAGRRATMVQSAGTTTYTYDDAGRMTALANPFSETTTWSYDAGDRVTRQDYSTGSKTEYTYDVRDRVTAINHYTQPSRNNFLALSSESYVYDDCGNLTSKTVNGTTTTYTYDDIDQLLTESRTGYSATYTYDANGNRATKTLNGTTETYFVDDADKLDEIKVAGVTVKSFGYDGAGRTTSVVTSAGTTTLSYDYESRVTGITYPSTATNSFTYNGLDTRVGKVDSAGTTTYLRDGAYVTDPVVSDSRAVYTPGISERVSSASKFYHTDRLGSTERLTNSSQSTTDTRQYDAFGMLVSSTGSTATPFGLAGGHGYQEDLDSGLKLLGHRYYDPSTGRFLTRDPAKDGKNYYAFSQNPLVDLDPEGLRVRHIGVSLAGTGGWAGSLGLGLYWDPDTGEIGLGLSGGFGGGLGVGVGGNLIEYGEDPTMSLSGPSSIVTGEGTTVGGFAQVSPVSGTFDLANGSPNGGFGLGVGPSAGGGLTVMKTKLIVFKMVIGKEDPWNGSMWNNWSNDTPKPNDRVPGTPWHNPRYY